MSIVPNKLTAPDEPTGRVPRAEKLLAPSTSEKTENAPDARYQWNTVGSSFFA
jgi:hypothetical protein